LPLGTLQAALKSILEKAKLFSLKIIKQINLIQYLNMVRSVLHFYEKIIHNTLYVSLIIPSNYNYDSLNKFFKSYICLI